MLDSVFADAVLDTVTGFAVLDTVTGFAGVTHYRCLWLRALSKPYGVRGPRYASLTCCPRNRQQLTQYLSFQGTSFLTLWLPI